MNCKFQNINSQQAIWENKSTEWICNTDCLIDPSISHAPSDMCYVILELESAGCKGVCRWSGTCWGRIPPTSWTSRWTLTAADSSTSPDWPSSPSRAPRTSTGWGFLPCSSFQCKTPPVNCWSLVFICRYYDLIFYCKVHYWPWKQSKDKNH